MRAGPGRQVRQLLLLCALALGVIGMHHLAPATHGMSHAEPCHGTHAAAVLPIGMPGGPPEAWSPCDPGRGAGHDLLHLCLAVLGATGGFALLAWLLLAVRSARHPPASELRPPVRHVWRLRRPGGRALLTSVCLLRI